MFNPGSLQSFEIVYHGSETQLKVADNVYLIIQTS